MNAIRQLLRLHAYGILFVLCLPAAAVAQESKEEFFEKRIRPILFEHCQSCHGEKKQAGGLRLDSAKGWQQGGDSGPAIVPGKPEESLLIKAVRRLDKDLAMPPKEELPASKVQELIRWVQLGAYDPRQEVAHTAKTANKSIDWQQERKKWAFQPPQKVVPPTVKQVEWCQNPIDQFILNELEQRQIQPAARATDRELCRRLHYDLTGLPPTAQTVQQFERDCQIHRDRTIAATIDRLLASPQYGEKWARHWLDVVRYADSQDSRSFNQPGDILDAWRYRDWVIQAFNQDLPYNQFIRLQIAGDLYAKQFDNPELIIPTGVYAIGQWGNGDADKKKIHTDMVDDQIDVTSRAFLGLTISCARCHDHKFDPILTADYYALAGFFFSSRIVDSFTPPGAGERLSRLDILSTKERLLAQQREARIAMLKLLVVPASRPLNHRIMDAHGQPGLTVLRTKEIDNPSVTINNTGKPIRFVTIQLPKDGISVHPGPSQPAVITWQSKKDTVIQLDGALIDADATCGNGIEWEVRVGHRQVAAGVMENGSQTKIELKNIRLTANQLLRILIKPRNDYSCDSTQTELRIRNSDGQVWSFQQSMLKQQFMNSDGWELFSGDRADDRPDSIDFVKLMGELAQLQLQQNISQAYAQGLQEGGISNTAYRGFNDVRIHIRGSHDRLGELVPRGFPTVFAAPKPQLAGSGRTALADWVSSHNNPLTARVMVNRLWQHHFGEGIVRTPNNFGSLGEAPTHPALLDWLALQLIDQGYSLKAIHRLICSSATYQQSIHASPSALAHDAEFRLFSRQRSRKLSAEEFRDTLLQLGGKLNLQLYGPSVNNVQSARRTMYLTAIRSDRTTFQSLFDGADPTSIIEKRTDSIVAPQALWLLNHPLVLQQAKGLQERLELQALPTFVDRFEWLTLQVFGRSPALAEIQLFEQRFRQAEKPERFWLSLCHAFLCSNEFAFVD